MTTKTIPAQSIEQVWDLYQKLMDINATIDHLHDMAKTSADVDSSGIKFSLSMTAKVEKAHDPEHDLSKPDALGYIEAMRLAMLKGIPVVGFSGWGGSVCDCPKCKEESVTHTTNLVYDASGSLALRLLDVVLQEKQAERALVLHELKKLGILIK